MKLYTRTGDDGTTGLFGGDRVGKDHPRVEAYGTVDELNACLGWAAAVAGKSDAETRVATIIAGVQSRLFELGADLATPAGAKHESKIARLGDEQIAELEQWIDELDAGNDPMAHFILPGGTELAARLHLARTLCRRAERRLVNLGRTTAITPSAVVFLNRLADLLFAMARRANKDAGVADVPWVPEQR